MGTIGKVDFLLLADSLAAQGQEMAGKMGSGVEANTASIGAQNNIDRIILYTDSEVIEELLKGFREQFNKVTSVPNAYDKFVESLRALNIHVGGVNAYLTAQAERVAPEFKWAIEMGAIEKLSPANTFSPVVDPMDTLTITGLNAATWTDDEDIDADNYYAANLILEKTSAAGAADAITVNLTCTLWDGTTEAKAVVVDASDAIGTKDDIGIHPGDIYIGVTLDSIVCGAGSAGETWKVISELERVVAL